MRNLLGRKEKYKMATQTKYIKKVKKNKIIE